ncbi:hypothetical protein [Actinomadura decatromicini]|uniref:Uncharacterized protein n=1 Tax=Actinomadura decatromicini TaxID=2604572 RepID=A0A5D3FUK1_9ACTN|nr:hypothetical protein [Actinomadura decatromicini]TYK51410.1 hypothetical protein FXF68_13480 [Actinomadura decatromicini]
MWQPMFRTGKARIHGEAVWGTAMYRDDEKSEIVFRRHDPTVGISPGHNPPLPDPGGEVISESDFAPMDWTPHNDTF